MLAVGLASGGKNFGGGCWGQEAWGLALNPANSSPQRGPSEAGVLTVTYLPEPASSQSFFALKAPAPCCGQDEPTSSFRVQNPPALLCIPVTSVSAPLPGGGGISHQLQTQRVLPGATTPAVPCDAQQSARPSWGSPATATMCGEPWSSVPNAGSFSSLGILSLTRIFLKCFLKLVLFYMVMFLGIFFML